jgi:tetratricopeptide (TPR) repeat protein
VPDDGHDPGDGASATVRPGEISALLLELARAPDACLDPAWDGIQQGTTVGRFQLVREIGRGGFGAVWEARDTGLGRAVALKLIRTGDLEHLREERMLREAEAAAQLSHPNIVTLFDVGRLEHGPYLVYELLRGRTLHDRIAAGPIPPHEAIRIATEIASGLAYAHDRGVVHRDLKPANVFLSADGRVKVLDFGLAHAFGRRRQGGGTPAYMAPEQWRGAPEDERTDVFALGVVLHQMLSGAMPFPQSGRGARFPSAPASSLDVPLLPALGDLVARMLDADPVKRPRDGDEVLRALKPIDAAVERTPEVGASSVRVRRRGLRREAAIAGAAILAILLVLGVALLFVRDGPGIGESTSKATAASGTRSLEAYQHHLRAMDLRMKDCDFAAAEQEERRALAADPEFGAAHMQLGIILQFTRESMEDAHAHLRAARALAKGMPDREKRIIALDAYATPSMPLEGDRSAHEAAAMKQVADLVDRYPRDAYVLFFAGYTEGVYGHWDRALDHFRRSLEAEPGQCYVLGAATEMLFRTGRASESIELARRAVAARPNAANVALLSMILARTGAHEEAAQRARDSLRLRNGGRQESTLHAILALASSGYPEEAEAAAVELTRSEIEALRRQGLRHQVAVMALQGRVRDAIALWPEPDSHVQAGPLDGRATLLGTGQPRLAAHESLRRLREVPGAVLRAGELAFHGDLAIASRAADELEPHSPSHAYYRAVVLAQERRWAEAIPALRALQLRWGEREFGKPDARPFYQLQVRLLLAEGLLETDRPAEALEALRSIDEFGSCSLSAVENLPRVWLLRARALELLDRPHEAVLTLDRFLHQWRNADPDLQLLGTARELRQRLAGQVTASGGVTPSTPLAR